MSFWTPEHIPPPFPVEEDASQTAWWEGLSPAMRFRWAPLLSRLDAKGRAFFQRERRRIRDGFRKREGTPERLEEELVAEEQFYQRVGAGIARRLDAPAGTGSESPPANFGTLDAPPAAPSEG